MSKKKSVIDKEFIKIKNMLNYKNPKNNFYMDAESYLHWFKHNNSIEDISKYFSKIIDFPKLKNLQINNLIENDITNLHKNVVERDTGNLWFELSWTALIINKYKDVLKDFPNMKLEFESAILLGNFEKASLLLDDIEEKYGYSFWLIRNRLIILQEIKGIEAQKKYVETLMDKDTSVLFKTLIYFISISIEENISASYFERRIESFFEEVKDSISTNYFMFKLNKTYYVEPKYFTSILLYEYSSSIIDIYETFIDITTQTILFQEVERTPNEFTGFFKILKKIDKSIDDFRLITIQRVLGLKKQLTKEEKEKNILEIYDNFLMGNYNNVIKMSQSILNEKPIYL